MQVCRPRGSHVMPHMTTGSSLMWIHVVFSCEQLNPGICCRQRGGSDITVSTERLSVFNSDG